MVFGYQKIKSILGLSWQIAKADFKLKNEGSFAGIFWYLLNPIIMFFSLFAIFSDRLGGKIQYYPLYLMIGIIMFNFFRNITIESSKVIRDNSWIIKSINFPRESLIISIIIKNLLSHFFEILFLIIFLILAKIFVLNIIYYFLILGIYCIFIFGFSLVLASLSVFFADVSNIWNYGVGLLLLVTPVFYAIEGQRRLLYINLLNPAYYFISVARELVIFNKMPSFWIILGALGYSLLFLTVGLYVFNKFKYKFSELI